MLNVLHSLRAAPGILAPMGLVLGNFVGSQVALKISVCQKKCFAKLILYKINDANLNQTLCDFN